jgi:hypothetical protein
MQRVEIGLPLFVAQHLALQASGLFRRDALVKCNLWNSIPCCRCMRRARDQHIETRVPSSMTQHLALQMRESRGMCAADGGRYTDMRICM